MYSFGYRLSLRAVLVPCETTSELIILIHAINFLEYKLQLQSPIV